MNYYSEIKNKEYERLDDETKNKLIINEQIKVEDLIKNRNKKNALLSNKGRVFFSLKKIIIMLYL